MAGAVRNAPNVQVFENILGTADNVGGGIASLGAGATSTLSARFPVHGARAVFFALSADADPSANSTFAIGLYFRNKPTTRQTAGAAQFAKDASFVAAEISETAVARVLALGTTTCFVAAIVADQMDITITNAGAGAMTNVRLDAHVIYN